MAKMRHPPGPLAEQLPLDRRTPRSPWPVVCCGAAARVCVLWVVKQETTAFISLVGGMVSISPTTYFSGSGFVGNKHNDRCGLDSPSNPPVPKHGATSVPWMPHLMETRFYCFSILLRLHRSFKVRIGLVEASSPSRCAYAYFHCFLYPASATGLGSSSHPNFIRIFTIQWRARGIEIVPPTLPLNILNIVVSFCIKTRFYHTHCLELLYRHLDILAAKRIN